MYGIIYKAVSPNGRVYIGQTKHSLNRRKRDHAYRAGLKDRRCVFQIALIKYGFDSFAWEQIDTAESQAELDEKEKRWIAHYDSMNPAKGYNDQGGGIYHSTSTNTRKKISESLKGFRHDPETCHKMSVSHRGEKAPAAKLTEADVRQIKKALIRGESGASLGRKYGVSEDAIHKIKSGKNWGWLQTA